MVLGWRTRAAAAAAESTCHSGAAAPTTSAGLGSESEDAGGGSVDGETRGRGPAGLSSSLGSAADFCGRNGLTDGGPASTEAEAFEDDSGGAGSHLTTSRSRTTPPRRWRRPRLSSRPSRPSVEAGEEEEEEEEGGGGTCERRRWRRTSPAAPAGRGGGELPGETDRPRRNVAPAAAAVVVVGR